MNSARRISPKLYTIGGGACSFSDICREMRLSIATKVFLGFAAVVVMSGAVSLFGIVQMHRIGQGLTLVSSGYFPLTRIAASLEGFQRQRERSTDGLLAERDPAQRASLVRLDRTYFARIAEEHLARAREQLQLARQGASARDRAALDRIDARLQLLSTRIAEEDQLASALAELLAREGRVAAVDVPAAQDLITRLKTSERRVGYEIRTLLNVIQEQMNGGLAEAERQERTARWAIVGLSLLALGVGLLVTWLSNRALAPIARLTQAAQRLGRGAPDAVAVPEGGADELAALAREFNAMAQRLAARERELRAQGEALVRSERLAAIGRIAAQTTHEIRNPLSSISLNAEELSERLRELPGDQRDGAAAALCDAIVREVDRLAAVTEEYLRYARVPKPQVARLDLNDAVRDLLDFVRPELLSASVRLEQKLDPDLPSVIADAAQIRQVLLNVVRNAREAMPSGGAVSVATRTVDGAVAVDVRDTGPGIDPARLARIFDPFFTTKERGTGLGLALAQEIAREHGGELTCVSSPGNGTIFTLRLPAAPDEEIRARPAAAAAIARS
jgi:two-component system, NtrC family, sensor kinase